MDDIKFLGCRLKRATISCDESSLGDGHIRRENDWSLENCTDNRATVAIRDRIQVDFGKGIGARFEADMQATLRYEKGVTEADLKEFIRKMLDEPALSMSNLVFGLLMTQMGMGPVILPPVWGAALDGQRRTREKKKRTAE